MQIGSSDHVCVILPFAQMFILMFLSDTLQVQLEAILSRLSSDKMKYCKMARVIPLLSD